MYCTRAFRRFPQFSALSVHSLEYVRPSVPHTEEDCLWVRRHWSKEGHTQRAWPFESMMQFWYRAHFFKEQASKMQGMWIHHVLLMLSTPLGYNTRVICDCESLFSHLLIALCAVYSLRPCVLTRVKRILLVFQGGIQRMGIQIFRTFAIKRTQSLTYL